MDNSSDVCGHLDVGREREPRFTLYRLADIRDLVAHSHEQAWMSRVCIAEILTLLGSTVASGSLLTNIRWLSDVSTSANEVSADRYPGNLFWFCQYALDLAVGKLNSDREGALWTPSLS
ncbi:hypothetical protein OMCYN_01761 [cyanobiont of Ornithocercus magnificus]|nr:hypothetical protein OMCYN_01761 [cyanobiont of Ornithocercus magnificus]